MKTLRLALISAALLGSCVSMTEPVQVGKDTYMMGLNARGGFSSDAELLARTIRTATAFCASQGRGIEVQSSNVTGVQMWTPQNNQIVFTCTPSSGTGA